MRIVKLIFDPVSSVYSYIEGSTVEMRILGQFFSYNYSYSPYLRTWVQKANDGDVIPNYALRLEIQEEDLLLKNMSSPVPTILRMKKKQFIKLFDEWRNVVCKVPFRPKELLIIYENGEYRMEVKKESFNFKVFIHKCFYKVRYLVLSKENTIEIVKFIQNEDHKSYSQKEDSNIEMLILGRFFNDNLGDFSFFCDWALQAENGNAISDNSIRLKIEGNDIILQDMYPDEGETPTRVKMKKKQFIKLCNDWMEAVYNASVLPQELAIIYENGEYRVEVKKEPFSLKAFIGRWFS